MIGAIVFVTLTDSVAILYLAHANATIFRDKDFASKLEYADPYIGLKEMYSNGRASNVKIDPIVLRPDISAQVFTQEPYKVAVRGEHDYWDEEGARLSPNERRVHVSPNVCTIQLPSLPVLYLC